MLLVQEEILLAHEMDHLVQEEISACPRKQSSCPGRNFVSGLVGSGPVLESGLVQSLHIPEIIQRRLWGCGCCWRIDLAGFGCFMTFSHVVALLQMQGRA